MALCAHLVPRLVEAWRRACSHDATVLKESIDDSRHIALVPKNMPCRQKEIKPFECIVMFLGFWEFVPVFSSGLGVWGLGPVLTVMNRGGMFNCCRVIASTVGSSFKAFLFECLSGRAPSDCGTL
eukprot:6461108-Amphidinium_carterae.1